MLPRYLDPKAEWDDLAIRVRRRVNTAGMAGIGVDRRGSDINGEGRVDQNAVIKGGGWPGGWRQNLRVRGG